LHIEEQAFALGGTPVRNDRGGQRDEDQAD
jgi:hypothetical protein